MKISECKALVLDDSSTVISLTRGMLSSIGFKEDNILFSQNPKTGVLIAQRESLQLIVCDFNFNSTLNGRQVLEELEHYQCLSPSSVFVLITGDSSATTVNSMLELPIDDYIIKPFNRNFLESRVLKAYKRKQALAKIYFHKRNGDFEKGIEECEKLLGEFPQYKTYIRQEKGKFLKRLHLWKESVEYYSTLSLSDSSEWIKLGLSNSLSNVGNYDEARDILSSILTSSPSSIEARKQLAMVELRCGEIAESIANLEIVRGLTVDSSERELVLSNLCLAQGDYENAYKYFKNYIAVNKDTHRDDMWAKINLVRRALLFANRGALSAAESLIKELTALETECEVIRTCLDTATAHLFLLKGRYNESILLMNACYRSIKNSDKLHFYDLHYFCNLLLICSFDSEFLLLLPKMTEALESQIKLNGNFESHEVIFLSMDTMMRKISDSHKYKSKWLLDKHSIIAGSGDIKKMSHLLDIAEAYPTLVSVRIEILRLLATVWPEGYGKSQINKLIDSSDEVITALTDCKKLHEINYKKLIHYAKANLDKDGVT